MGTKTYHQPEECSKATPGPSSGLHVKERTQKYLQQNVDRKNKKINL
jgi:hypothetical protein